MANRLIPAGDHVLVIDAQQKTVIGGIELPDNVKQQEMAFGVVAVAGPLAVEYKPKDLVAYGPYAGKIIVIEGSTFRILRAGQIEGKIVNDGVPETPDEDDPFADEVTGADS